MAKGLIKPFCNGTLTQSGLHSFIASGIRSKSNRWAPKYSCRKKSKRGYNQYECALCHELVGNKSIRIDHIEPVVDPVMGFQGWDEYIKRTFVEEEGFQALCTPCHDKKTAAEREIRKANKNKPQELRISDRGIEVNGKLIV